MAEQELTLILNTGGDFSRACKVSSRDLTLQALKDMVRAETCVRSQNFDMQTQLANVPPKPNLPLGLLYYEFDGQNLLLVDESDVLVLKEMVGKAHLAVVKVFLCGGASPALRPALPRSHARCAAKSFKPPPKPMLMPTRLGSAATLPATTPVAPRPDALSPIVAAQVGFAEAKDVVQATGVAEKAGVVGVKALRGYRICTACGIQSPVRVSACEECDAPFQKREKKKP